MKRVLGLDLGSASIGWAIIDEVELGSSETPKIVALGSRIVPEESTTIDKFVKGQAASKCAVRTERRAARRGIDRYQLRREHLTNWLRERDFLPTEFEIKLPAIELWGLRSKAVNEKLSPRELGRVIYHLNQKRGYKSSKEDAADNKQSDYLKGIADRYADISDKEITIGQFFHNNIVTDSTYRCKEQIFPRKAYIEEFDTIINCQRQYYPQQLTDDSIDLLRNRIIYYQRPLKSCKHLISMCEFEKRAYTTNDGRIVYSSPRVAPRSSPIFQYCKLWESVNNLSIRDKDGNYLDISVQQRKDMVEFMNFNEKLKLNDMYKILNIKKKDGWWAGKAIGKGLQGNTTLVSIASALEALPKERIIELTRFDIIYEDWVDKQTGEVLPIVSPAIEKEPLYRLWHLVYSISDRDEFASALDKQFGISDVETVEKLFKLDFVKAGYGNKSVKAIRRIIPFLSQGLMYSYACERANFRHSESLTKQENLDRELQSTLKQLTRNELRQPVVEKILNQMINVVNSAMSNYGVIGVDGVKRFDEIRIELARELKQSQDERNATSSNIFKNEKKNAEYASKILEHGFSSTRSRIQKYKMYEESNHSCVYCGKLINIKEFLSGFDAEVEHIVPRAMLFDDSFSNKVCSCRDCNKEKGKRTAFDYMSTKGDVIFGDYKSRVKDLFDSKKISKTKYERLLMAAEAIPEDFISRQLRESQYIARKAKEILQQVCRNVSATSGGVTDFIRHVWGWDKVLHDLNFDKYEFAGLVEDHQYIHRGATHTEKRITGWSKRMDHRHHALDALVIASTKPSFIQRINRLNTQRDVMFSEIEKQGVEFKEKHNLLTKWVKIQPHFSTDEVRGAIASILVSFKAGKKVATIGRRFVEKGGKRIMVQDNIVVPRGALSEESVYGTTTKLVRDKKGRVVKKQEYVIKYPLSSITKKDLDSIVDKGVRRVIEKRLAEFNDDVKKAYVEPLFHDKGAKRQIRSVRCYTGLSAVVPVKYNQDGKAIGFVKPGNNHHVAIYRDRDGKLQEHVTTFWHAVERKKFGLPAIITDPSDAWDKVLNNDKVNNAFLDLLPDVTWTFENSMQQNEMFIMGMDESEYQFAIDNRDYALLSKYLYRVQKLTKGIYYFRHHLETTTDDKYGDKREKNETLSRKIGKMICISSLKTLIENNPRKVRINVLGEIIPI